MTTLFRSEAGRRLVHERYRSFLRSSPVRHEERRIPTCQGETFVLSYGPEHAPPVVLFHGGGVNSSMWLRNLPAWGAHFRIYAVDIIGEPGFSAPSRPAMTTDDHARWLDDVWNALSITQAHVLGASMGGWMALDYAIRRQAKVRSLVLLAPGGIGRLRLGRLALLLPLLLFGSWGRRTFLQQLMGFDPQEARSPLGQEFIAFCELVLQHFVFRSEPIPLFSDDALRTLTMPVMVVLAGRDGAIDTQHTRRRLAAFVPHARIHYLPDAGHALTDQTDTVLEFLRTVEAHGSSRREGDTLAAIVPSNAS